jgi:hypothetical protein
MAFPITAQINAWFQAAHTDALAAGGSVYIMEKYAEREVVKRVLYWAYTNLLEEVAELGYGNRSRITKSIEAALTELLNQDQNTGDNYDDYEENQQDDEDDKDEGGEIPMTMETLTQQVAELLVKALVK